MSAATSRVFSRIPGDWTPSQDNQLYMHQGYDVLANGLAASGDWKYLEAPNDYPDQKNHTYGHTEYMFIGGERGGPLATYLKTATARSNFAMWTDTAAKRIIRTGPRATGVEVSCSLGTGYSGTAQLTPEKGRVIVSAGTFGTPKVLFRSTYLPLSHSFGIPSSAVTCYASMRGEIN